MRVFMSILNMTYREFCDYLKFYSGMKLFENLESELELKIFADHLISEMDSGCTGFRKRRLKWCVW